MTARASSSELAQNAWAETADLLDLQLSPLGLAAMDRLDPRPGETVLDIGCGAGQTVRQLAERVGPSGTVIGVDIAPRLLDIARARTTGLSQVRLVRADAGKLALPDAVADGIFSRFGFMAIDDPVAAFSNFRRMLKSSGRLGLACWRALEENELDLLPLQAAGLDIPIDPTPFRFERSAYLADVLRMAGFGRIGIEAADIRVSSGGVDEMTRVLTKVGPLGKILREAPALLPDAEPRVRTALTARASGGDIGLKAAIWVVSATAA
jgi:ubiquinone/menaquinone biosynthesis C-methylase UbiE